MRFIDLIPADVRSTHSVAVASPAAAVNPAPVLRLVHRTPLVLRGAHFRSRERVTVTARTPRVYQRKVVTRDDGSFSVTFGAVQAARCAGLRAEAVGGRGDRASLWIPRQTCIAPPSTA